MSNTLSYVVMTKITPNPIFLLLSLYTISRLVNLVCIWCRILHLVKLGAVSWIKPTLLSNSLQHKLNNVYHCHTKENSFLLPMFSFQLHINTTEHEKMPSLPLLQLCFLQQSKGLNYVFTASRLDNWDFNNADSLLEQEKTHHYD